MSKEMLTVESFGNKLNFENFTNLEKAIDHVSFSHKYLQKNSGFEIFTQEAVDKYIAESTAKVRENLTKGEGGQLDLIKGVTDAVNSLELVKVRLDNGDIKKFYVRKSETNLEKSEKNDLEKGALDSLSYSSENNFVKTGKEVKEKIAAIKTKMQAIQTNNQVKMDALVEKIGFKPTSSPDEWTLNRYPDVKDKLEKMKRYPWECTSYNEGYKSNSIVEEGKQIKVASSKEEADLCREYNKLCYEHCDAIIDEHKADVYLRNMDEKKQYKLTLEQLTQLGF